MRDQIVSHKRFANRAKLTNAIQDIVAFVDGKDCRVKLRKNGIYKLYCCTCDHCDKRTVVAKFLPPLSSNDPNAPILPLTVKKVEKEHHKNVIQFQILRRDSFYHEMT